jgi:hypothetical protein
MTFNYTPGGMAVVDRARLALGDTDESAQPGSRLEDEEIASLVAEHGYRMGVYHGFQVLAARFARRAEGSTGPQRIVPLSRAQELRAQAERWLRSLVAAPVAGGLSKASKATREQDPDLVAPTFRRGMLDRTER